MEEQIQAQDLAGSVPIIKRMCDVPMETLLKDDTLYTHYRYTRPQDFADDSLSGIPDEPVEWLCRYLEGLPGPNAARWLDRLLCYNDCLRVTRDKLMEQWNMICDMYLDLDLPEHQQDAHLLRLCIVLAWNELKALDMLLRRLICQKREYLTYVWFEELEDDLEEFRPRSRAWSI